MKHLLQALAMMQPAAQARRCLCCRRKLVQLLQPPLRLRQHLHPRLRLCLSMAEQACMGMLQLRAIVVVAAVVF